MCVCVVSSNAVNVLLCRYVLSVVNSSDNSVDVYDSEGEVINFDSGEGKSSYACVIMFTK